MNSPPTPPSPIETRKADHLRLCIEEDVQFHETTSGLERYRFAHCCLPELDRADIDLTSTFLGKKLAAPLLISSMTGGTELAKTINYLLADVAQQYKIAMGVGSQRIILENPELAATFAVRRRAPDILLFANIGAVQLNYNYGVEQCQKIIDILEADALILHLNPLQECIQTEGDTNFKGLLDKIDKLCAKLPVPVIAKEVGNGISGAMAQKLIAAGVAAIDVAGAGGTSWAKIEGERAKNPLGRRLGATFADWGIPTAECIVATRKAAPDVPLIASGGLQNGLDAAKALALGANLAGLARLFLQAAAESESALNLLVEVLIAEIATVMFCTGCANLYDLQHSGVLERLR